MAMATKTSSAEDILNQVLLVQIEAHIWSGRKKLQNADLPKVNAIDLPPSYFASLGSKKIIDTEALKIFDTLKKAAHRTCEAHGVRFLGGYAIPLVKVELVGAELDSIEAKFEAAKVDFIKKYPSCVESWLDLNPSWAHAINAGVTETARVESAIGFAWQAIHVKTPRGKAAKLLNRGITKEVNGLSDQLFKEISASAKDMLEKTLLGKNEVTRKSLGRVNNLRDKLRDLSFLNPTVTPLVHSIDYVLTLMPPSGSIEGASFNALYQMVELLGDPARAMAHGIVINKGMSVEDAVSECVLNAKSLAQMAQSAVPKTIPLVASSKLAVVPEQTKNLFEPAAEKVIKTATTPKVKKAVKDVIPVKPVNAAVLMEKPLVHAVVKAQVEPELDNACLF
jgi:hypothetical protein